MAKKLSEKPVEVKNPEPVNNPVADFLKSDNTDMEQEKTNTEMNDEIDNDAVGSDLIKATPKKKSAVEKLENIPRKYWKHQTV